MCHENQFVGGVEGNESAEGGLLHELLPSVIDENPFDKILAYPHIVEAAVILDRQQRKVMHESLGKNSDSVVSYLAGMVIYLNFSHAAARRFAFEDKTAEVLFF